MKHTPIPSRLAVVAACLAVSGCHAFSPAPKVTCTRHSNGEVLHGEAALAMDDTIAWFDVRDANGLPGRIDASNSNAFTCVVQK